MDLGAQKSGILNKVRRRLRFALAEKVIGQVNRIPGCYSLASRLPATPDQYPRPAKRRATRQGLRFELDIANLVDWSIYFNIGADHPDLVAAVSPGDVVIDVGANIGQTAMLMARAAGATGAVYALEPDPVNFAALEKNISLNPFKNIHLDPLAMAHLESKFDLFRVDPTNPGMNRILPNSTTAESVKIQAQTLDGFVARKPINKLDLIKIDVEGFEMNVLKGAEATLKNMRPKLFIELSDGNLRQQGSSALELVNFISSHGYKVTPAAMSWESAQQLAHNQYRNCHLDILCLPSR